MTTSIEQPPAGAPDATAARAADHLWMHFARQGRHPEIPIPVVTRGEGAYIWDNRGRKILDGLSGLFVVQVGHGRREMAEVAARQAAELAAFHADSTASPPPVVKKTRFRSPGARAASCSASSACTGVV